MQDRETTSKSTCLVHQTGKMHQDILTLFNIFTASFFRNCSHFASCDHNIHFEALLGPQWPSSPDHGAQQKSASAWACRGQQKQLKTLSKRGPCLLMRMIQCDFWVFRLLKARRSCRSNREQIRYTDGYGNWRNGLRQRGNRMQKGHIVAKYFTWEEIS